MAMALALSRQAIGLSDPNPRVGCVITDANGHLLGAGHTQRAGGPHAEVMALRDVVARGHAKEALVGAHVYVTLEPCAHHGRTPPCCEALSAARVGHVHIALADPNPLVAGKGRRHLEEAGIACELGLGADEAREINIGFLSRMVRGRPYVRMKIAASLDGRTALPDGRSQWITGPAARQDGHGWRQRAGAILTGIGTVRDDDPRLDLRLPSGEVPPLQPLRVIADSRLATPPSARILQAPGNVLLVHALESTAPSVEAGPPSTSASPAPAHAPFDPFDPLDAARAAGSPWPAGVECLSLPQAAGGAGSPLDSGPDSAADGAADGVADVVADVVADGVADGVTDGAPCPSQAGNATNAADLGTDPGPSARRGPPPRVDLAALMTELGRRGVNELHVEAGATLNGALLQAGLVDELLVYLAPKFLGDGRGMATLGVLPDLQAAPRFELLDCTPVGDDVRLRLRRPELGF